MARLVVVSNRVSVPERGRSASAGGLEVALRAALKQHGGIWFGWSGRVTTEPDLKIRTQKEGNITYIVTDLREEDYKEFYTGFANRVLWPILHYRLDLAEYSRRDLSGYLRVNEYFANELHKILEPDDTVWVHDYHLIPLADDLRGRGHANRLGFFLHIPCPPPEILTGLPNHERLIPTLCRYDLIGFQTDEDADNFGRYLTSEMHLKEQAPRRFVLRNGVTRVGAFPVGVDMASFARAGQEAINTPVVQKFIQSLEGRAMIIGVDRLDYSKGLPQRMESYEKFLAAYPGWRNKVTYLQITPKSRSAIPEYADMERQISEMAGRINGAYGELAWTPIRYVNRAYARPTLAGLFRAAKVALVTPLRDGMNLVAKEFVAAQNPDDPGVLILSRFAGASRECREALLVNPADTESVANAIARALSMPLEERKARHQSIVDALAKNDLQFWADRFLAALTGNDGPAEDDEKKIA